MDQKVEIKEEPVWLEGTASTSFDHCELVLEKTHLKEETKSELADPGQAQLNTFEHFADVKDEILVEEHPVPLVPCFKEGDNEENDAVFTRSLVDSSDSCCNVFEMGSEQMYQVPTLIEQSYCSNVYYQYLLSHSGERPNHHKEFSSNFSLEVQHESKISSSEKWPNRCNNRKSVIKEPTICPSVRRSHSCPECGKMLTSKNRNRHMLTHTKERPYQCSECSRKYSSKANLVVHMSTHTGVREYHCNECGKVFAQRSCLKAHEAVHSNERPFHCVQCSKTFSLKKRLQVHMIIHAAMREHKCDDCGKQFTHKYHLKKHLRLHSGERPFLCDECGTTFSQRGHLNIHKRTHAGRQPFLCHECGLLFCVKSVRGVNINAQTGEWLSGCDHRKHLLIPFV
ncbi:zinc finger protein 852-like isoform X1 [Anabrus simplex]|uniref:zinc finger protein 852-like isoform X1 n=1 Tax=Anabrus simplex TaxID=316456 RepID=UPI0035A3C074